MSRSLRPGPTDGRPGGAAKAESPRWNDGFTKLSHYFQASVTVRRQVGSCKRLRPTAASHPTSSVSMVRFIRGCDGDVQIDASRRLVTKTYLHPHAETAIGNARREADY